MLSVRKCLISTSLALFAFGAIESLTTLAGPAAASEIKLIVNRVPVTTYDIQRRVAFLKLQRRKGNLNAEAEQAMVDQALHNAEAQRLGVRITDDAVTEAYNRFAKGNKMTVKQLDGIMSQSGVTKAHFKEFIRSQMAWNQALAARNRSEVRSMSEQDVVQRMLKQGGTKPTATEYMLQHIIFVVPASERGKMASRKREAEAMRARFSGCERTRDFAKGLVDVTVRDLGRKFGPELPPEWAEQIKKTKVGGATGVRETNLGVEFIGICSSREVSDDRVAKMVFQLEGATDDKAEDLSKKYTEELREKANIVKR
ncbi:MAG: peptidylprolyl isomerase [Alphaproteobacteria bacterium]|nr:peptidylprolyl isomerase [Alphaproteobacteria bacterium]MBU0805847.1 peptidylprolyl isomerase [Alphaproteobacteria bacterium]MBU0874184.1 peptidylprolyl isomerase [Alphaproteobacteria bacterium]MBU1401992.1 peptidylprolyl isomerase [Alphaproteobacteria bacterium]MBU1590637.1 peptidylprolyl isomerase [Alphaproteobacteria bacterium]